MLRNNLKIAWRTLKNHRALTFINLLGLSIGMACFALFLLYAVHEFNYDGFHQDPDRIYRVYRWSQPYQDRLESKDAYLPMPLAPALENDYPDIEKALRFREDWGDEFIRINGVVSRKGMTYADPRFFQVFDFPLIYGDQNTALANIDNIVLTEKTAIQLFGESNPTGKILEIQIDGNFTEFKVAAIAANIPTNSSIQFDMLASFNYLENHTQDGMRKRNHWNRESYHVYVKLKEGSNLANDEERLLGMRTKYYPDEEKRFREGGFWTKEGSPVTFGMQPIKTMHTNTEIGFAAINPKNIWLLLSLAFGVLLIACINFTTLAIGRSISRSKEVGVRKVIGSKRKQIIWQFLVEAMLMASISMFMGLVLTKLLLPSFNNLSGVDLSFSRDQYPLIFFLLLGATVLSAITAGSYPAFVLSSFKPVEVLRNRIRLGGSNIFTKSLVTFQFILSISLIIATLIIIKQVNFLRNSYPGFQKENILVVDASGTDVEKVYPLFRQQVLQNNRIKGIAASELGLGEGKGWSRSGWRYKDELKEVYEYFVDNNYLDVLGIELLAGRNFQAEMASDTAHSVVINETMAHYFGWSATEAIGQELSGYFDDPNKREPEVIGVVKDFNFRPLTEHISPQMFHQFSDYQPYQFFVRLGQGEPSQTIGFLEETWSEIVPGYPFLFSFLEEDINSFYKSEERFSSILRWAGFISIFLACLGLFGLSALASLNRRKEIGIRKVLGASVLELVTLLSKDFVKLVLIAMLFSIPLAWYFMKIWLEEFAYHISIEGWMFLAAAIITLIIAFFTVGIQGLRAAWTHPVDSLRSE